METNKSILKIFQSGVYRWAEAVKTFCILIGAVIIAEVLRLYNVGDQNLIMVYLLSVLIISRVTIGYGYGIIAAVLSVLAFDYLITEPRMGFSIMRPGYPITFSIMLIVSLITSTLTIQMKTQARLALEREHRTELFYEINKKILSAKDVAKIVELANRYIVDFLKRPVIFYANDPGGNSEGVLKKASFEDDLTFFQSMEERQTAHWVFVHKHNAGFGTEIYPDAKAFYIPIVSRQKALGVIGVSCASGNPIIPNDLAFLRIMASQVSIALELEFLADEQRRIVIEAEKEKMRGNLLRAISHDLRTPLTGISGASSVILEQGDLLDKKAHDKLISDIREDAQWLIRMVENLLSVTRIREDTMNVTKTLEAVEEIVAESIGRIKARFPQRKMNITVPDELLLVPMDGTLIEQVMINLLENAIKYSKEDTAVDVTVFQNGDFAVFEVGDGGPGIAEQDIPKLFKGHIPTDDKNVDASRSMGIGLSICKSIVKAHHGTIEAINKKNGGAIFRFTLPMKEGEKNQ